MKKAVGLLDNQRLHGKKCLEKVAAFIATLEDQSELICLGLDEGRRIATVDCIKGLSKAELTFVIKRCIQAP